MAISGNEKAYTYALSNVARSGATRSGYVSAHVFISVGGAALTGSIKYGSLSIVDNLDEAPNRCTFRVIDSVPATGQEVIITLGSTNGERLFAGHVLTVDEVIGGLPTQVRAAVSCVDYTWALGFQKVTKRYANQSATAIAQDLIATYAAVNGFTAAGVAANLPTLTELTYTNEDLTEALTRLARRIGGYWYVDYWKNVQLFLEDPRPSPYPVIPTNPTLAIEGYAYQVDRSQALTRVYVEGRGSRLLGAVATGDTLVPLDAVEMFAPVTSDVFLKASFQGSDGGAQHLDYTGIVTGGGGTIVGPGIGPSAAPTLTRAIGTGVTAGVHAYAVTFVTATGESLPSPTASITAGGQVLNPTVVPTGWTPPSNYFGNLVKNGLYQVKYAYATDTAWPPANVTLASPPSATIQANTNGGTGQTGSIETAIPCSSDPTVKFVIVYRTTNGGSTFYRATRETNVPGGSISGGSVPSDADIVTGGTEPAANTTPASGAVALTAIPIGVPPSPGGVSPVTQRKIYRTAANSGALKFLITLANNTATTYTDTSPDASLGAAAPTGDTSGLTQPAGQVLPGSTHIPVAAAGPFQPDLLGGWAIIGNGEQVIRYGGNSLGDLIGIPTSGIGSITAAVVYNSTITAAPMLTGIPSSGARAITRALTAGDELYLVVQVDDTARQAQLAAVLGGNGIREEWVQDRRLSIAEARARGAATLALRPLDQGTLQYRCRDITTAAGKTVLVNLGPGYGLPLTVVGTFRIQQVTIDNFRTGPDQPPTYTVQASTTRFSFEDWLRKMQTKD